VAQQSRTSLDSADRDASAGENRDNDCLRNDLRAKWSYSKTANENKDFRRKLDHGCVLFVQHPSKNGVSRTVLSGSFIACAEAFGNCDVATEGGIPRSSRF
jgi:hypothetical protein